MRLRSRSGCRERPRSGSALHPARTSRPRLACPRRRARRLDRPASALPRGSGARRRPARRRSRRSTPIGSSTTGLAVRSCTCATA
jgi:hypothetical protein